MLTVGDEQGEEKFATREKLSESPARHGTSPSDWRTRETPAHGGETVRYPILRFASAK